ncbi:hypothetical protein KAX02_04470 [candidate division WOR-3 bacterium]|nr:hypothetical protein [candidate division WOR-3 bacterium]
MKRIGDDVLKRLEKHLIRTAEQICDKMEEASEKHSGSPEMVARAREAAFRKTMERFFPFPYKITKGELYDSIGRRSSSIDCVICAPNHPHLYDENGNIEIILVDGVHAAIELKPDLKDLPASFGSNRKHEPEIIRALKQAYSVKVLKRTRSSLLPLLSLGKKVSKEKIDYSYRCPTYIFSYDSSDIDKLCKYVSDYYIYNNIPIQEQIDMLFILKKGLIINNKCPDFTITKPLSGDQWIPHIAAYSKESAFLLFVGRLVSEIGPEMTMSEPVLTRYFKKMKRPKAIHAFRNTK